MSEPYEADLLLLKLRLESQVVSEWVIVENSYSFQGAHIGLFARELVDSDERFAPYADRIKVISADRAVKSFPPGEPADLAAFQVEYWQRNLAMDYLSTLDPDVWIMVCDVDEMLDGTSPQRVAELNSRLSNSDGAIQVPTQRFWYDFDNLYRPLYGIPLVRLGHLDATGRTLTSFRRALSGELAESWGRIIAFEYTSCFGADEILRKFDTQSHTGYSLEDLQTALRCNHRVIARSRRARVQDPEKDFLDRVQLTPENSPEYVRLNLDSLRTGNIPDDYLKQRQMEYPEWSGGWQMVLRRFRQALRSAVKWVWHKAIYSVRRLGFRNFMLFPEPQGPSPWLDQ